MKRVLDETTGQFRPFYPKGRKSENPEVRSLQEQNDKLMARLEALEKKDEKVEEVVEAQSDFSLDMKKDELMDVAAEMNVSVPEGATKKNIFDLLTQKKEELELEAMDDSEEDGEL